jgi:hypothetical protein
MLKSKTFRLLFLMVILFVASQYSYSQVYKDAVYRIKKVGIRTITFGPYLEAEKGKYFLLEIGLETQIKKLNLDASKAHGVSFGLNYDFKSDNFGFDLAYWMRPKIIGFTFGGNLGFRSDLSSTSSFGIAPTIGYKFWMLHAQAGFYLWTVKPSIMNTNSVFVALKFAPVYAKKRKLQRGNKGIFN